MCDIRLYTKELDKYTKYPGPSVNKVWRPKY